MTKSLYCKDSKITSLKLYLIAVAYLGFHFGGGGVQNIFEKVGVFPWRSHAFARGVRGHATARNVFLNVHFGEYFAKILSKIKMQKYSFFT